MPEAITLSGSPSQPLMLCLSGAGGLAHDWARVAGHLGSGIHVVALQRPARAESLVSATNQVADFLTSQGSQTALLVGHSMGGFVAEATCRLHPGLVRGMVLVDSSVAQPHSALTAFTERALQRSSRRVDGVLARLAPRTSARSIQRLQVGANDLMVYESWNDDLLRLRTQQPLPEVPITVITALRGGAPGRHTWARAQDGLVITLRADPRAVRVRHVVLRGAGHLVHLSHPAQVATEARTLLDPE